MWKDSSSTNNNYKNLKHWFTLAISVTINKKNQLILLWYLNIWHKYYPEARVLFTSKKQVCLCLTYSFDKSFKSFWKKSVVYKCYLTYGVTYIFIPVSTFTPFFWFPFLSSLLPLSFPFILIVQFKNEIYLFNSIYFLYALNIPCP